MVTKEVDEVYHKLVNKGLKIAESPKLNKKFNIYHFFFKDPNGYTIEIQRFLEE
ncbi:MAG: VOC family protein [Candidatus Lokiarchaeota archaeon]|nr:VOC family protein [Candidatus Lokiarchaeota archaeon]